MNWRIRDHRGFQRDAIVVIGAAAGIGGLAWALPLAGATAWMMMAVGSLLAILAAHEAPRQLNRHLATAVTGVLGAVLAGATWRAFAGDLVAPAAGDALLSGLLAGLAASSALVIAHVERVAEPP